MRGIAPVDIHMLHREVQLAAARDWVEMEARLFTLHHRPSTCEIEVLERLGHQLEHVLVQSSPFQALSVQRFQSCTTYECKIALSLLCASKEWQ